MLKIKHSRAAILELVFAILGITGLSISDHYLPSLRYKIIAGAILFVVCVFFIVQRDKRIYRLKSNSQQLAKFFAKWYGNNGKLIVFCNDLDWVETKILDALVLKASRNELCLYLGDVEGTHARHLKAQGAHMHRVSAFNAGRHKFSMLEIEQGKYKQIICRNKVVPAQTPGGLIEFVSTNSAQDPHLIAFVEDTLNQYPKIP
jgi:hypothetical protein